MEVIVMDMIRSDGKTALDWNKKGFNYLKLGNYQEAVECYRKALEIEPQNIAAWN